MESITKIAEEIIKKRSNFSRFHNDFSKIKKKLNTLEGEVVNFKDDNVNWKMIEVWKPLAQEIIEDLEKVMGKVEISV